MVAEGRFDSLGKIFYRRSGIGFRLRNSPSERMPMRIDKLS
jgi:hypothetical protein